MYEYTHKNTSNPRFSVMLQTVTWLGLDLHHMYSCHMKRMHTQASQPRRGGFPGRTRRPETPREVCLGSQQPTADAHSRPGEIKPGWLVMPRPPFLVPPRELSSGKTHSLSHSSFVYLCGATQNHMQAFTVSVSHIILVIKSRSTAYLRAPLLPFPLSPPLCSPHHLPLSNLVWVYMLCH